MRCVRLKVVQKLMGHASMETSPLVDVPSMEGLGLRFVANHFDVVPVRTQDECCVVIRVVVRAQSRRTVQVPSLVPAHNPLFHNILPTDRPPFSMQT